MAELTKAQLQAQVDELTAKLAGLSETDKVEEALDTSDAVDLKTIAVNAREKSAEVARIVNPTNVFALKFEALAFACDELIALFDERGHTGIPEEYK